MSLAVPLSRSRGFTMSRTALTLPLLVVLPLLAVGQPAAPPLDPAKLLVYRDDAGETHPVKTIADWQRRKASVLKAMQSVMGPLPGKEKRCPLDVKIDEEVDCGSYVRRKLTYAAEPGARVPAYLLVPKAVLDGKTKAPGVLSLHPTNKLGYRVTVGLANYPNAEYGRELAERGYVVLATPYPLLSDYNPDLKKLGYQSGTMKAIWDNVRGLDLLDSLPFVRPGQYAAIGHSLGGHNSVYTAAFDDRIKVAVSSCGLDSYRDYMDGKIQGWTSDRYMPKLLDYKDRLRDIPFDFHEIVASLAPRHVLIVAPLKDTNFRYRSVDKVAAAAADVYRLYGAEKNLHVEHPDVGHEFSPNMRELAYRVIDGVLKK
jgi:dienelactone hydrolase